MSVTLNDTNLTDLTGPIKRNKAKFTAASVALARGRDSMALFFLFPIFHSFILHVKVTTLTQDSLCSPCDDGQVWRTHAGAHKQHHILVPSVAVGHHLTLKGLQLLLIVALNVNEADSHLAVPTAVEHLAKAAFPDHLAHLQLLQWDVPLLQKDAGLTGLTREIAGRQQRQVHLLKLIA